MPSRKKRRRNTLSIRTHIFYAHTRTHRYAYTSKDQYRCIIMRTVCPLFWWLLVIVWRRQYIREYYIIIIIYTYSRHYYIYIYIIPIYAYLRTYVPIPRGRGGTHFQTVAARPSIVWLLPPPSPLPPDRRRARVLSSALLIPIPRVSPRR